MSSKRSWASWWGRSRRAVEPYTVRPGGQVQQVGGSQRRPYPVWAGRQRCRPGPRRFSGMVLVDLRRVVWQREPHAVGHPAVGEELNGLLCASGPISAHQHFSTGCGVEPGLVQYPADDPDVVGRGPHQPADRGVGGNRLRRAPCRTAAAKGPTGNGLPGPRTPPDPP